MTLRVLVIDEDLPLPANSGKKIRTWALVRRLASRHQITFLSYGSDEATIRTMQSENVDVQTVPPPNISGGVALYLSLFQNLFSRFPYSVTKHYSEAFQRRVRQVLAAGAYDIVQCEWTPYANFLRTGIRQPVILSTHNIEAKIWERRAANSSSPLAKVFFGIQHRKMESFERWAFPRFGNVAAVSETDAGVARQWGARNLWVVNNGVDLNYFAPGSYGSEVAGSALFVGSLDWFPNQDGLNWFVKQVLPIIRRLDSGASVRVVGRNASPQFRRLLQDTPGVNFVGGVDDVRDELRRASIVVVPLRIGGGTRIKILEAMASGRAVISTSIGAEGLNVQNGVHLRTADEPARFAETAVALLHSPEDRRHLAAAGRKLVENEYSWDRSAQVLESAWLEIAQAARRETQS